MKFVVSRDLRDSSLIRLLLIFFFIFLLMFFALQFVKEQGQWGLTPGAIHDRVLGNASLFLPPLSLEEIVEAVHIDLFFRLMA